MGVGLKGTGARGPLWRRAGGDAGKIAVTSRSEGGSGDPGSSAGHTERRLAAVLRFIPVMVFSLDGEGLITSVSEAGVDMMEMSSAEAVGRNLLELVPAPGFRRQIQRALAGERVRGLHSGGQGQYFHTCLDPVFDSAGNISEIVGVSLDVTEAWRDKQAIRQLRRENRRRMERGRLLDRVIRARAPKERGGAADAGDSIRELLAGSAAGGAAGAGAAVL